MNLSFSLRATLVCLLIAFGLNLSGVYAQPRPQSQGQAVYLPLLLGGATSRTPAPTPTPPQGSLPTALVGTWFSGQLLPHCPVVGS